MRAALRIELIALARGQSIVSQGLANLCPHRVVSLAALSGERAGLGVVSCEGGVSNNIEVSGP